MSTFSTTYGINADNFIDAEFVDKDGAFFNLNDSSSPNLYSYKNLQHKTPRVSVYQPASNFIRLLTTKADPRTLSDSGYGA